MIIRKQADAVESSCHGVRQLLGSSGRDRNHIKRPVYIAVLAIAAVVVLSGVVLLIAKFGRGSAGLANAGIQLVKDGKALATVVVDRSKSGKPELDDAAAAKVLADWIKKITDVSLPTAETAPQNGTAIYVGAAAVKAGLKLDDIQSASKEGLRIKSDGNRILIGGQNPTSTVKAVCRFLEEFGCRYFMEGPMGEVYPRQTTLSVGNLNITEQPGFLQRSMWGFSSTPLVAGASNADSLWKIWNGTGGISFNNGQGWGSYLSQSLFAEHPEYFAMDSSGQRKSGDWACTSNPAVRELFASNIVEVIKKGTINPSLSPPDGNRYCLCSQCKAQDDSFAVEPSSGTLRMSNRYADFFDDIARRVAKGYPGSVLSFLAYADYTQPPTSNLNLSSNLCAVLTPMRFCRLHAIGNPNCPSRMQFDEAVKGWSKTASHTACYMFNGNLAENTVPFSMISVWKHDIPYFKEKGCEGMTFETWAGWEICGPHVYLSMRLAYNPKADADKIMDDYFMKFFGSKAGPFMKEYWMAIDQAFANLKCHSGGFYSLPLVYTPEFLEKCRGFLDRAVAEAKEDKSYSARVAMHAEGFKNAVQFRQIFDAMNRGDFIEAKKIYDNLHSRAQEHVKIGFGSQVTVDWLARFLRGPVEAGAKAVSLPNKVVQVLPDQWHWTRVESGAVPRIEGASIPETQDVGIQKGYHQVDFDDSSWQTVLTWSKTLDAQGIPDKPTVMWYRTSFKIQEQHGKLTLYFAEIDGMPEIYINGQKVGERFSRKWPFSVDVTEVVPSGENSIAIKVDHSVATDLCLGGILRPVLLIEKPGEPAVSP